ncbi:MAG: hypothetical protein IT204_01000 [Fimbriimonadaceae bacterium]|nr:hypothetical protein [Fimbriimonadaceae bacterium]
MVVVAGDRITVSTSTVVAEFERGRLLALRTVGGEPLLEAPADSPGLQLVYANQPSVDVLHKLAASVTTHRLSDHAAQFRLHGWEADGVITIREDLANGDVLVEPAAATSRPGVQAVRWSLAGVRDDLQVVAPFFQGVRLDQGDALLQRRWPWPIFWEAGLLIFAGRSGGWWVHCQDRAYRFKAVQISGREYALETEAYGPLDRSLGGGGLVWRLNAYQGTWQEPAGQYRQWLWQAYDLGAQEALRRPWQDDVKFAVSWFNGDPDTLEAIAERIDPRHVLVHFSQWRTDAYDENYPTYQPAAAAQELIAAATARGFHVMPHCNSVDMDPTHETYPLLRDFQYRDAVSRRLHGWGWDPEAGGVLGVPSSNLALAGNRRRKVMIKVHPGLSIWRSILSERIADAVQQVGTDTVFIDVTLCSGNLDNCLVENTTASEGMNKLIREIAALGGGLAVGGEGLNEITFQGLSFAQAHLLLSWHASADGLERAKGCPLGDFLFGRLCRTFGYSRLGGLNDEEVVRMQVHESLGALPTITVRNAAEIRCPNPAVARQFALAGGRG